MNEDLGLIIAGVGIGITFIGLSIAVVFWFGKGADEAQDLLYRVEKLEKHIKNN